MAESKNYIPKWNRSLLYIIAISWLPPPKKRNRYITVYIIYMWLQNGRGTLHFQALGWKVQGEEGRNVWASLFIFHITCFTSLHLCYGPWASALPPELILSSCASWPRRASRWSSVGSSPFVKGWWRRLRALVRRVVGSWAAPERPLQRCYGVWTCTTPPPTCCCVDCTSQWSSGWSYHRFHQQHRASRPWPPGHEYSWRGWEYLYIYLYIMNSTRHFEWVYKCMCKVFCDRQASHLDAL